MIYRQSRDMEDAVKNLGVTYTDDQVNQLAQRHFENTQVYSYHQAILKVEWRTKPFSMKKLQLRKVVLILIISVDRK